MRMAVAFLPCHIRQLMNLPASLELCRGSGLSVMALAVRFPMDGPYGPYPQYSEYLILGLGWFLLSAHEPQVLIIGRFGDQQAGSLGADLVLPAVGGEGEEVILAARGTRGRHGGGGRLTMGQTRPGTAESH